jgi:uncharacterized protein
LRLQPIAVAWFFVVWVATALYAQTGDIPPVPTRWVTDTANFMSPAAVQALDARLEAYERQSGHQLLVYIGRTTGIVPIEDFAENAFEAWKVGRQGIDDGLILFIMADDRRLRMEVGYGLEGEIPDALAGRIINQIITPRIRDGNNDQAVSDGMDAVIRALGGGEAVPDDQGGSEDVRARGRGGMPIGQLIFFVIAGIVFLILFITNPTLAIYILANILAGGGRHGRGGGFGGGGGGGFRGGGGRSGGGGASGSW